MSGIVLTKRLVCKDDRVERCEFENIYINDKSLLCLVLTLKNGTSYAVMVEERPQEEVIKQAEQYLQSL